MQVIFNLIVLSLGFFLELHSDVVGPIGLQTAQEADLMRHLKVLLNVVENKELNHLLLIAAISVGNCCAELVHKAMGIYGLIARRLDL